MSSLPSATASKSTPVRSSNQTAEEAVELTRLSTTVSGNRASDNSVQANGPIAGKITNIYCGKVLLYNSFGRASNTTAHLHDVLQPSVATSQASVDRDKPKVSVVKSTDCDTALRIPPPQYISLYSDSCDKPKTVRAVFDPKVKENWVSHRIVRRLELKSHPGALVKEADFDGVILTPTGRFVDFACPGEQRSDSFLYRFYIVKHSPFDLLFGSGFISSIQTVSR